MDVVIPAGGTIDARYAQQIGTPFRALAALGPGRKPVLQIVVDALRESGCVERIIGVAPAAVAEAVQGADLWITSTGSGPSNILRGLAEARPDTPALVCTSDLPLITADSVREFARNCARDAAVCVGLVTADTYHAAFPDAPPSKFVVLRDVGPVSLGCLFRVSPAVLTRHRALLDQTFSARKNQWRLAGLLGLGILWQWATRSLRLSSLIARGEQVLQARVDVLRDVSPVLAYDMDTADDYSYAHTFLEKTAPDWTDAKV